MNEIFAWGAVGLLSDQIGKLQLDLLVARGLRPEHYLLDMGCGSLGASVQLVGYLDPGHYVGIDTSVERLTDGRLALERAGLQGKRPILVQKANLDATAEIGLVYDYAIASSVFTELPLNSIMRCVSAVGAALKPGGTFFATFFEHTGPRLSREHTTIRALDPSGPPEELEVRTTMDTVPCDYDPDIFRWMCEGSHLTVEYIGDWGHPRQQKMVAFSRPPLPARDPSFGSKVVLTVVAGNEEDVIDEHLRFHFAQGVDFVIATDSHSVDRTPEILQRYEREGVLRAIRIDEPDVFDQARWVTDMARMAYTEYGADWVINSDADEFWWPEAGTLKSTLEAVPEGYGTVVAPRVNFTPVADEKGPFFERMTVREVRSFNHLGGPLPPKVCHRASAEVVVDWGNHGVRDATLGIPWPGSPILILHFPSRSYQQLENKAVRGGAAYARNTHLPPNIGGWQSLYAQYREGTLREYYETLILPEADVEEGVRDGRLVVDRRLADFLRSQGHAGISTHVDGNITAQS